MSAPIPFATVVVFACVLASPCVGAAEDDNLPEAVNRVERETGGRVLSAERRTQSGREVNRIKVYTPEGRVRVMWDDPRATPRPTQPRAPQKNESAPDQHAPPARPRDSRAAPPRRQQR